MFEKYWADNAPICRNHQLSYKRCIWPNPPIHYDEKDSVDFAVENYIRKYSEHNFNIKTVFSCIHGISITKMRRLWDRLIFLVGNLYWQDAVFILNIFKIKTASYLVSFKIQIRNNFIATRNCICANTIYGTVHFLKQNISCNRHYLNCTGIFIVKTMYVKGIYLYIKFTTTLRKFVQQWGFEKPRWLNGPPTLFNCTTWLSEGLQHPSETLSHWMSKLLLCMMTSSYGNIFRVTGP